MSWQTGWRCMPWRAAIRNCANTTERWISRLFCACAEGDAGHTIAWQLQSPAPPPITQGVPVPSDPEVARPMVMYLLALSLLVAAANRHCAPFCRKAFGSGVTVEEPPVRRLCSSCRRVLEAAAQRRWRSSSAPRSSGITELELGVRNSGNRGGADQIVASALAAIGDVDTPRRYSRGAQTCFASIDARINDDDISRRQCLPSSPGILRGRQLVGKWRTAPSIVSAPAGRID